MCKGSFSASDGWIQKLKVRNGIKQYTVSGEFRSCDMIAVNKWIGGIDESIKGYALEYIFSANETGYFFKALPNTTFNLIC